MKPELTPMYTFTFSRRQNNKTKSSCKHISEHTPHLYVFTPVFVQLNIAGPISINYRECRVEDDDSTTEQWNDYMAYYL